ncbi:cyclase [Aspergillus bombycis]|uniref:Cyclase n=1 Tax=Aspergillus bombycis TaxID=109264 RepID=A0A1F7ZML4_9EURO|nr:cyclase [Aspergillus bombycis]OGM40671.1 cyclase [Aspergillus bombycis]
MTKSQEQLQCAVVYPRPGKADQLTEIMDGIIASSMQEDEPNVLHMVPVLVNARGLTVRQAVKETEAETNRNIECFDQIANALLEEIKLTHPEKVDEVSSYVDGCRYNQMANFLWRHAARLG